MKVSSEDDVASRIASGIFTSQSKKKTNWSLIFPSMFVYKKYNAINLDLQSRTYDPLKCSRKFVLFKITSFAKSSIRLSESAA